MNRTIKNIIMISIVVVLIGITIFTIYWKVSSTPSMGGPGMGEQMQPPGMDGQTPPEMPNGNMQQPPEMPSGDSEMQPPGMDGQTPPEMPNGEGMPQMGQPMDYTDYCIFFIEGFILSSLIMYLIVSKFNKLTAHQTFDKTKNIAIYGIGVLLITGTMTIGLPMITSSNNNNFQGGPNGQGNVNITYKAQKEITTSENLTEGSYTSETADENAISVSGDVTSTLENITVTKTGDSSGGDNTSFYGINSAIIAKDGAKVTINNATIETNATGANGVFSYGGSATTNNSSSDGTTITISNSKITTKKDNSGGIMTTGGGTTIAKNLTITTEGTSSAAIRSDRGGGTVTVEEGTYTTNGLGSPAIYSTADITVKNATLNSTQSEGAIIEGKNKITLENVTLTDNNTRLNGQSTTFKNVFLYQSMSGDAAEGAAEFSAKDSTITTKKGDSFYVTNTTAKITLENNTITNEDSEGYFLRAKKDSWGNSGSNGGAVTLTMTNQKATGDIYIDEVSTLDMTMKNASSYTGAINKDNVAKSIKLTLDKTSTITLTGDSYITELSNKDTTNSNINFNGYKLYVNGKAIN